MEKARVLAVVGVTAGGKTALAEAIAARLDAEIVCADSRQVFAELDVGTGKPSRAERAERPHHLFEALSLGQRASAGWYAAAAAASCARIHERGRVPMLVGGSGLYLRALERGLSGEPPHDPRVRARLAADLVAGGPEALHRRLVEADPTTAARLRPRDAQRILRALEVAEASGRPLSWWHAQPHRPALDARWSMVEITVTPRTLADRITRRTEAMFEGGLIEEVRSLLEAGRGDALRALRAVGYDEALDHLAGTFTRTEAVAITARRTRQLAKRQRTWFRHQVPGATRIAGDEGDLEALAQRAIDALRDRH